MPNPRVERIVRRAYRNRLKSDLSQFEGWFLKSFRDIRPQKIADFVENKLNCGYRVSAGYYTTAVRGYHDHVILWK